MLKPDKITPELFGAMMLAWGGEVTGYDPRRAMYHVKFLSVWSAAQFEREFCLEMGDVRLLCPVQSFGEPVHVEVVIDPYWRPAQPLDSAGVHHIKVPFADEDEW
jgi:hypothetical protein